MQLTRYITLIILFWVSLVIAQKPYSYTDGTPAPDPSGGGLPQGALVLKTSGTCPTGTTEATELDGVTLIGTTVANGNAGSTGGNNNITPTGTNTDGAVNAHSGTAVANHAAHTHDYTTVLNHTHTVSVTDPGHNHTQNAHAHTQTVNSATTGGLNGYAVDTSTNTATNSGYSTANATATNIANTTGITASTANPGGGAATGTTGNPSATLTHSVTQPDNHTFTQPTFTGNSFDNRSAFMRVIVCRVD